MLFLLPTSLHNRLLMVTLGSLSGAKNQWYWLVIPTKIDSSYSEGLLIISRGTAIVLLLVYCAYIWFQVCFGLFPKHGPLLVAVEIACLFVRGCDSTARGGTQDEHFGGGIRVCLEYSPHLILLNWRTFILSPGCWASPSSQLFALITASFASDTHQLSLMVKKNSVVASIEETAERYHIPKPFIGLILLPIVVGIKYLAFISLFDLCKGECSGARHIGVDGHEKSNGAYHYYLCWQFNRKSMLGSSHASTWPSDLKQIAAFVVPLLVIVGWMLVLCCSNSPLPFSSPTLELAMN